MMKIYPQRKCQYAMHTEAFFLAQNLPLSLTHSPFDKFDNVHVFTDQGGFLAIKTSPQAEYPTDGALSVLNLDQRLGIARSKIIRGADADVQGSARECTFLNLDLIFNLNLNVKMPDLKSSGGRMQMFKGAQGSAHSKHF